MSWEGRHPDCICTKSMGDNVDCLMHRDVYEQRQAGCSCWAGWRMADGTTVDPYCDADEYHTRAAVSDTDPVLDSDDTTGAQ